MNDSDLDDLMNSSEHKKGDGASGLLAVVALLILCLTVVAIVKILHG